MPFTVTMPKLSPTMESGVIAHWHKQVGDHVNSGEVLLEVSTDKATVEYEALDEGFLRAILVKEGQEARVNDPVAIFTESADESIEGYAAAESGRRESSGTQAPESPLQPAAASAEPVESGRRLPSAGAEPPQAGLVQPAFAPEPPLESYAFRLPRQAVHGRVIASPLARKLALEQGLDLTTIKGSGPGGRIMSQDLSQAQKTAEVSFGPGRVPEIAPGTFEEEKLSPMRRVIAQRLREAKTFIPHFYTRREIDVAPLWTVREQLNACGVKLSVNDFVIRACALALRQHPAVNSAFNSSNNTISRFLTIDICVAVSVEGGLITPIVRHADYKNLGEISAEVRALAARAKAGKLEPQEYKGGSFTISNMGMYGVDDFVAIINPPQAAILAVSAIRDIPVVKAGQIVPGKVMNLTLSADHRVVDGAAAAQFLHTLKHFLENPASLLLPS